MLAGLAAAGCSPQDFEEIAGDVGDSTSPPAGVAIPFEEVSDDLGERAASETRILIRTQQGYRALFGHAAPAGVDFAREWMIFYAAGTRPTGGYDANLSSLTRVGDKLVAVTALVSPGAGCVVTEALTTPYVLVKFAAQPGTAISFLKKDSTHDCETTNPCAAILCPVGSRCQVEVVVCVAAPCPPLATCVPDPDVTRCGGIAGIPCPGGGRCADDPSDSCDPQNGGADCGGICQCVQTVACVRGAKFDSSPKVCACVPQTPPTCGPVCDIFCQYGHVLDANGCPTCACNPPPTPSDRCTWDQCPAPAPGAPNFTCPDGVTIGGPACALDARGVCGWIFVSCPTPTR